MDFIVLIVRRDALLDVFSGVEEMRIDIHTHVLVWLIEKIRPNEIDDTNENSQ